MTTFLRESLVAFEYVVLVYFLVLNTIYLSFSVAAYILLRRHRRRWTPRALSAVMRSSATPGVSVIAPAHNEEATVVESVRSLLQLNYPQFEVVLVNDGSTDTTVERLVEAFGLVRAPLPLQAELPSEPIRAVYRSPTLPELVVVDKSNGGKADALNAGISLARHDYVCLIDADSILEPHALTRSMLPFLEDPTTIAGGGIIRVANGCQVDGGRVTRIRLPGSLLARFQVVEYLRAFLPGRVTQSAANGLLIISGAFGIFKKEPVISAGGLRRDTIGEDMEIVVRLHRLMRERRQPYRIVFQPDPVCWTEVPESTHILSRQRNRWQRGTLQVLNFHRGMIFNPRYGVVGLLAMPYYIVFEALGPIVEAAGYVVTAFAVAFGLVSWEYAELVFLVAVVFGTINSVAAVLLEELSFRKYPRLRDLLWLMVLAVLENFGYRQLTTWWRIRGVIDFLRGKQGWGVMTRKGFRNA